MSLSQKIRNFAGNNLPFLRMKPAMEKSRIMSLRPVRHSAIEWEKNEDFTILRIPNRKDKLGKIMKLWFRMPETRAVELDELGSFVWGMCDGENPVDKIIKSVSARYKLNRREVEMSVATYLQMLADRNFIGFFERGGKTT